jgi:2-(1,2-epoxy-1,2-dihydrophenyl)acetyl-CoA isomerase
VTTLRCERDGALATVVLDRPERLNAMTNTMARELTALLDELATDDELAVLVLTGEGRGFCPGADLTQLAGQADGEEPDDEIDLELFRSAVLLHELPAVTVAAVNGACAGAGLGWAAACDLRFAARGARFSTAFLDRAVAGDMGLPWSLPRLVGAARARHLSFFPDKFTADQAAGWGLVHEVFDDDAFRAGVEARVARLLGADRTALRTLKANYVAAETGSFAELVHLEASRHLGLYAGEAFRAAVREYDAGRAR